MLAINDDLTTGIYLLQDMVRYIYDNDVGATREEYLQWYADTVMMHWDDEYVTQVYMDENDKELERLFYKSCIMRDKAEFNGGWYDR